MSLFLLFFFKEYFILFFFRNGGNANKPSIFARNCLFDYAYTTDCGTILNAQPKEFFVKSCNFTNCRSETSGILILLFIFFSCLGGAFYYEFSSSFDSILSVNGSCLFENCRAEQNAVELFWSYLYII
jgi:hypothetical protein